MSDDNGQKPKKPVNPIAMIGPAVAIGASLVAVFIATSNTQKDTAPATNLELAQSEPTVGVQSVPQSDAAAPLVPLQPGTATTSPDGSINFVDESLTFSAMLPKGPADDPTLKRLNTEALAYLEKQKPNARADFDDRKRQGAVEMSWDVQLEWKYTAKAANIVSLVGTVYEFTGGAHGMSYTDTIIARADTGEQIKLSAMLMPDKSPSPAIVIAVCEALKKEKTVQIGSPTIFDEPIVCAGTTSNLKIEEANFAFAPSTEANKFGGLFVYYDAYAVGSYAEGPYTLTIPQEVFKEDLRAEYKMLFSGAVPPAVR